MLPEDIGTRRALAHLCQPDVGPSRVSRRRFLQAAAAVGGGAAMAGYLPGVFSLTDRGANEAWAAPPIGPTDGVLVTIMMGGGNDGLNTVVPIDDGAYYAGRGSLAIAAGDTLDLGSGLGLHPKLPYLKSLYDQGNVAIVEGVGRTEPDLSHFSSMGAWMQGSAGGPVQSGWLGRWLDGLGGNDPLQAATMGSNVPLHLIGAQRRATALPTTTDDFGTSTKESDLRIYDAVRALAAAPSGLGAYGDALAASGPDMLTVAAQTSGSYAGNLPPDGLARQMALAARLISADVGLRIVNVHMGDFDTHANQPNRHDRLMAELDAGLAAFYGNLASAFVTRTTVMTFSEFGRTLKANDSAGTDHGSANSLFVIGPQVAGGIHGQRPLLTTLDDNGRLVPTVDFRSVYATVLDSWLAADSRQILGAAYEAIPLFRARAGTAIDAPPPGPTVPGTFVGIAPERRLDTRSGLGATKAAIAADSSIDLLLGGRGSIPPAQVTAVVMNVTATEPTAPSFLTVWPTGEARPTASNLNFAAGVTVPNLVLCKLGSGGKVSIYNHSGDVHAVADAVGFVTTMAGSTFEPLVPARLLDTREAPGVPVGTEGTIDLVVTGVGGVPASSVQAVVLNVIGTNATAPTFVTVWPAGESRPTASTLNLVAGQTAPNLVMAKVGAGGAVSLFNHAGNTHLVVDVMGYYTPAPTGSRLVAVSPSRLLDTREGSGPLGQQSTLTLPVEASGVVPAGATAVALNVTSTEATQATFMTVWPSGVERPWASNLNIAVGQTVPNMVVSKIGAGGAVDIYNHLGRSHVVVDVVGYFVA